MPRPSRAPEILAAALACFAERGYDATRVKHIAERAGVSEAALYRHHPSKEAVATALFATHMRRYAGLLETAAGDDGRPARERVTALVRASLQTYRDAPDAYAFVLGHQSKFMDSLPADFPYPIRIVDRVVAAGQRDHTVKAGPVRVLSALVIGCMHHPVLVAQHAASGTIDLGDPRTAGLVADGAWAAIAA